MPEKKTFLHRLQDIVRRKKVNDAHKQSVKWLKAKLQDFAVYSRKEDPKKVETNPKFIKTPEALTGTDTTIGSMFVFWYDAKHKDTLPFWDRFPLIIMVGPAKGGFYGLNMHYLPQVLRANLFDALFDVLSTKNRINDNSRFLLTYEMLKKTSSMKYFKPTFKHYLTDHVDSQIRLVPADEWIYTLFLDTAQWQKASKAEVYTWSRSRIK